MVTQKIDTDVKQVQQQPTKLVIGYALGSKKKKRFFQPNLEVLGRENGISFIPIDRERPLAEQGQFDVLLHKLLGNEWQQVIEDYQQKHPEVTVLDPPGAIQRICNRESMLQGIEEIDIPEYNGMICVPKHLIVLKDTTSLANKVAEAGLKFPLVAKPLLVDGTAKSHQLSLAFDNLSLAELEPPLVLEELVNHGGVMFKVFVISDVIKVVQRFSLPNISNCGDKVTGVFQFPRVSSAAASVDKTDLDSLVAELPPKPLLKGLVKELQTRLGLRLFNIDLIREHGSNDLFYVIDINYFPGYENLPDYEQVFIDFFLSLAQAKHERNLVLDIVSCSSTEDLVDRVFLDIDIVKLDQVHLDVEKVVKTLPGFTSLYFIRSYRHFEVTIGTHIFLFEVPLGYPEDPPFVTYQNKVDQCSPVVDTEGNWWFKCTPLIKIDCEGKVFISWTRGMTLCSIVNNLFQTFA